MLNSPKVMLKDAWGLQARTSNVPDFDFTMYAEQRLEQYHRLKRL